jgi:signal transduction histidine kinase
MRHMSKENPAQERGTETNVSETNTPSMELIAHIQSASEHQRALLARELHDELGGLLVGAVMDLAWAEQHLSASPTELKQKLSRARHTLATAIDLKRKLIEDLRPTLLDNVGLFAALRWHIEALCKQADVGYQIEIPAEERRFLPNIPIALFRIVQESFALVITKNRTASAVFSLTINPVVLTLRIAGEPLPALSAETGRADEHSVATIEQRTAMLNGDFTFIQNPAGTTSITANFPLDHLLTAA